MKFEMTYDSAKKSYEEACEFEIRTKYDAPFVPCRVLFEQENLYLEADGRGNVAFYALDGTELYRKQADGNDNNFEKFYCRVCNGVISVRFPIIEERDHYPNCDGEFDRYSYVEVDNVIVTYALN